jgi:metal-dependent amidase/aminoacylase/carboxypeptidase family protein
VVQQPAHTRFYGCPADESLGRASLVKAGCFDDFGIAVAWHPANVNIPHLYNSSANTPFPADVLLEETELRGEPVVEVRK